MAEDDALFQKGMPIRREVLGPEYVDASMARADEFMMSFQRATTAWAWGWAWGDPTLDRKTRSLMNLAMLTALNRAPEIKLHVKGALIALGEPVGSTFSLRCTRLSARVRSTRAARSMREWQCRVLDRQHATMNAVRRPL
jgi:alkylhydroperoxidase/carboxymuconolactone decarboxylase family protein YurZ